jgi:hypothetical protein
MKAVFSRVPDSRYLFVEFAECSHVKVPDIANRGAGEKRLPE